MINLNNLTFDDVLKNPEKIHAMLSDIIYVELNKHNRSLRALAKLKVPVYKKCRVEDMIKLLEYDNQRRE